MPWILLEAETRIHSDCKILCLKENFGRFFVKKKIFLPAEIRHIGYIKTKRKGEKEMAKRLSPTNIIFLDVDGVLNNMAFLKGKDIGEEIDMRAVERLAEIYKE